MQSERRGRSATARATLGVLDVYGLESLAYNSLERLAINYAAERVQAATLAALRREPRLYTREGLEYREPPIVTAAVSPCPASVALLAVTRAADDDGVIAEIARLRDARVRPLPPHHFRVQHFAGPVTYCARGAIAAERDAVSPRLVALLHAADDPLLARLFPTPGGGGASSLCGRQRTLVAALERRLASSAGADGSGLRLVRCLRADVARRPGYFDAQLVRSQLRTQW